MLSIVVEPSLYKIAGPVRFELTYPGVKVLFLNHLEKGQYYIKLGCWLSQREFPAIKEVYRNRLLYYATYEFMVLLKPMIDSVYCPVFGFQCSLNLYFDYSYMFPYMSDYIFILYTITIYKMPPISELLPTLLASSYKYFSYTMLSIVDEPYSY